jgi:hypothetical protein
MIHEKISQFILISIFMFLMPIDLNAQKDYNSAIGVRGAPASGITFKHFTAANKNYELILTTRWEGFNLTGLYEINQVAFDSENFNFFYGFGGHVGFWDTYNDHPWFDDDVTHVVAGVDGIIGLEYTFNEIPFNISIDWKPAFNIINHTGFWADEVGFSVRYVIN